MVTTTREMCWSLRKGVEFWNIFIIIQIRWYLGYKQTIIIYLNFWVIRRLFEINFQFIYISDRDAKSKQWQLKSNFLDKNLDNSTCVNKMKSHENSR